MHVFPFNLSALLPPTLTVNTSVISETDSVTLHCQAPASASVHHCYFYTGEQQSNKGNSCLQTLTGTELLFMSHQRSPAEVKVRCFYTVKYGAVNSPSPHSDTSSITRDSSSCYQIIYHTITFSRNLVDSASCLGEYVKVNYSCCQLLLCRSLVINIQPTTLS